MRIARLTLLLWLSLAAQGYATTYYTGKLVGGASNSNNCTSTSTPCLTIGGAIAKMAAGDTLYIMGTTTYQEIVNNTIPGSTSFAAATTVAAYPGDSPTVQAIGSGSAIFYFEGSASKYIVIDGLILDGNNSSTVQNIVKVSRQSAASPAATFIRVQNCEMKNSYFVSVLVTNASNSCEFLNNTVHDGGQHLDSDGLYQYAFYISANSCLLEGNNIYNMGSSGIQIFYGSGSPQDNIVRKNNIHNNTVLSAAQGRGAGITISATSAGSGHLIYNNIIRNNYIGIFLSFTSTTKIQNNTIVSNTTQGIWINSGSNNVVQNNLLRSNGTNTVTDSGTNTTKTANLNPAVDPFTNAAAFDFTLVAGSAPIGAGVDLSAVFTTDYAGNTRTVPYDVGAYEFSIPASITVLSPNGGESWTIGSTQTVLWSTSSAGPNVDITEDQDGNGSYETTIATSTPNDGSHSFTVTGSANANRKMKVKDSTASTFDVSDAVYAATASTPQTITVTYPTIGLHFFPGQTLPITWTSTGISGNVAIYISYNNGTTYQTTPIVASQAFDNPDGAWAVDVPGGTTIKVKVVSLNDTNVYGESAAFKIAGRHPKIK